MFTVLTGSPHFGETNPLTDPIAAPSAIAAMSGLSDVVTTQPGRVGERGPRSLEIM
jgi:hypothetical protein